MSSYELIRGAKLRASYTASDRGPLFSLYVQAGREAGGFVNMDVDLDDMEALAVYLTKSCKALRKNRK